MTKRIGFTAVICSLAFAAAGCGDDEDNKTLSYDDTGTEIGEICDSVDLEGLNGDPANDAPILESGIADFETAIEDVRDLDVDEELESTRDEFADNGEEQVAVIKEAQAIAEQGDKKAYQAKVQEIAPLDAESNELASKLGADACIDS